MPKYNVGDVLIHPSYSTVRTVTAVGKERYLWTTDQGGGEYSASHDSLDRWTLKPKELKRGDWWSRCEGVGGPAPFLDTKFKVEDFTDLYVVARPFGRTDEKVFQRSVWDAEFTHYKDGGS